MPPAGHSVGLALEDGVLLARLLETTKPSMPQDVFPRYQELRRPRIENEYKHALQRWEGVKTISWWLQKLREYATWIYLAIFARHTDKSLKYNIFTQEL
jgi:2-polyprenyl-6-methoxyphenol hydroxylase-like FAD-dependent oxidoreductase